MKRFLLALVIALILGGALGSYWVYRQYQAFLQQPLATSTTGAAVININPGTSYGGMVRLLQQQGHTGRIWPWRLLHRLEPAVIQAGEYRLQPGTQPRQWLRQLSSGDVVQYTLTIVEGWTFRQLLAALEDVPYLQQDLRGKTAAQVMTELGYAGQHPEGRFLPETYAYVKGDSDIDVLRRAYAALEETLAAVWAGRDSDLPLDTPYQLLTLASIVEKETGVAAERPMIAGVFVRRLNKGMLLQTDPTIIYGLGEAFDGNLRRRDLVTDGPYNTYTRPGLTPTPIALPGKDALLAVAHPADGQALYFVAKGDGTHYFSATLTEHNRAVNRYQRGRP